MNHHTFYTLMRSLGAHLIHKQSSQSDTFLCLVGTYIANVQLFTWKKSGNTVCHSSNKA